MKRTELQAGRQFLLSEKGKIIHVLVLESENESALNEAVRQIKSMSVINFMTYRIEDSRLRMVFAALKEGATSSQ